MTIRTAPEMSWRWVNSAAAPLVLLLLVVSAPGCRGTLYKQTGKVMSSYAVDHMVPHMMASDDVEMACETGVSMGAFLTSFGRVTKSPDKAGLVTLLSAGMCAEGAAWEAELRGLRAIQKEDASEAQDARIAEKRAHYAAARRFYTAFRMAESEFGKVGGECPSLDDDEEVFYLLGLSAGLLAVVHDRAAEGLANVPMDIPPAVVRASDCLDDDAWWGAPGALKAALWTAVPGAAPEGADPWASLEAAAAKGDAAGVRLARAFQAQAASGAGRDDALRAVISAQANTNEDSLDASWRLLDRYATLIIRHESDKIWTRQSGHRTPVGMLGNFGEDVEPVDDSLLEGLEE